MSTNTIDDLLAGGAKGKTAKFDAIGKSWGGPVVSAETRQATDPATGVPQAWDDGNPKMQIVIGIQTDDRNPEIEGDDGIRFVYIKAWGEQKKALQAAAREAGGSPAVGDTFSATYVGDGKKTNPAFSAPKLFKYAIKKGNPLDSVIGEPAAPAPAAPQLGGLTPAATEQVKKLIGLGLDDAKVAAALDNMGVTQPLAAQVRLQVAAGSSDGF